MNNQQIRISKFKKSYEYFKEKEKNNISFSFEEVAKSINWKISTVKAYYYKKLKCYLDNDKKSRTKYYVNKNFNKDFNDIDNDIDKFVDHMSQVHPKLRR